MGVTGVITVGGFTTTGGLTITGTVGVTGVLTTTGAGVVVVVVTAWLSTVSVVAAFVDDVDCATK